MKSVYSFVVVVFFFSTTRSILDEQQTKIWIKVAQYRQMSWFSLIEIIIDDVLRKQIEIARQKKKKPC